MPEDTLRPGLASGVYPERHDDAEHPLERALRGLRGHWLRQRAARLDALQAVAERVEEASADVSLDSDARLTNRATGLRRRLALEGLRDELVIEAFALVREIAGRVLGTPHYPVQIMGGWVIARGMLAEMETGEGKTLTATLPAATAALAGVPVHVISANDYLVERDAEAMRPIYRALGLSVGTVSETERDDARRRDAYRCDITYATAKTIAFDYLRDRLQRGGGREGLALRLEGLQGERTRAQGLLLRGLCYAVIDEADSVLIDEARTPLVLSGAGNASDNRRIYRRALRLARALEEGVHFRVVGREGRLVLDEQGRKRLEELAQPLGGLWAGPRRREEWVERALSALHLFQRDRDYIVRDDQVQIVDALTGRSAPDRSWEAGLHQLIELKEGCSLTPENETLAKISYQQFFRRYLRLSGMTGTAREVAPELWSVYGLNTVRIPTRRPVQRRALPTRVFVSAEDRWRAVVERARSLHARGRPILIGTTSVAASEQLSERLTRAGLEHQVLNARQDAEEAAVVARAGRPGRITVATSMAGRGTDIPLAPGVSERGGLHVIATQRSEARRIDRQLFGRCGRQGGPGSYELILSLADEPVKLYHQAAILRWASRLARSGVLPRRLGLWLTSLPQRSEERRHARMRRELIALEEHLGDLLAFSGPGE
ncbi:MAG: prepilin peptidase [Myxococcota bacterium]|nr:prepilin peptidase [Myxococcota bacterium]